jgi:HrpA-like RNA helicase
MRLPLEEVCLRLATLGCSNLTGYLSQAISAPPIRNIERSVSLLKEIGALDSKEKLTPLGYKVGQLPLDVRLGRTLLYGVAFKCLNSVAVICAMLSLGITPFATGIGRENEVKRAKEKFLICIFMFYANEKITLIMQHISTPTNSGVIR